jgi:leucine dehydrogenase
MFDTIETLETDFDAHEQVVEINDPTTGLRAIIAIHSTFRGPGAGGCRLWAYGSRLEARKDALRLSRGMSYKNAMADLRFGGAKAVIMGPISPENRTAIFEAFGRAVQALGGTYITAEDVGVSVSDMMTVANETRFVSGLARAKGEVGGDPSPFTATGVRIGIEAAVKARLGRDSLEGVRVAVQGLGHVGTYLCEELKARGAKLSVADINPDRVADITNRLGVEAMSVQDILLADVDVVAPCALGSIITPEVARKLKASIIAGGANNQLSDPHSGKIIFDRDILYAPDYVINAGGIIAVSAEYYGDTDHSEISQNVLAIGPRLTDIFETAKSLKQPTEVVAERMARAKLGLGS